MAVPTIHFPEKKMSLLDKMPTEQYTRTGQQHDGDMLGSLNVFHLLHCVVGDATIIQGYPKFISS